MDTAVGHSPLIKSFQLSLIADGLKPHTISCYIRDVDRFLNYFGKSDPQSVTPDDTRQFVSWMQSERSAKTVHESQLAIRRFYKFLVREGEVKVDPTRSTKLVRYRVDPQPTYTPDEVGRLLSVCAMSTPNGVRDRAMVTVLFDTGVRAGELVSMGIPDWERRCVWVDGKTGPRLIPLGIQAIESLDRYVRRWTIKSDPIWRGKKGPLTGSGVLQLVRRLCARADVPDKGVHAFRRAAAAQMKRLGMQDSDILEVMGWKDITMLRRYTAEVADELAAAAHARFSPGDALSR
ncbi:MAG: tyrosine-type recombinase/integrase [Chloroflexi bacterium]|nr:tyrosine-type recombinase/integrase [Chloroflexota bacterium]